MRTLAISAHPDDETLGCGGTLLKHQAAGDEVFWLIATGRREPWWSSKDVERRRQQIEVVAAEYGVLDVHQLDHDDSRLDQVPLVDLIEGIDEVLRRVRPEVIYVVHGGDVHTDHVRVNEAAMSALKAFRMGALGVRRLLAFETISSTEAGAPGARAAFVPNVYNDITRYLEHKCRIMGHFDTEWQSALQPRSPSALSALARLRGATIGVEYAEAFMLLRELT